MCSEIGVRVMVAVAQVYVRAYRKLIRSIKKYFWVLMVEARVHANFIIIYDKALIPCENDKDNRQSSD